MYIDFWIWFLSSEILIRNSIKDSLQFSCHVPQNSPHSSPSIIRYQNHLISIKMSDDSDSDFGFGSSSPFLDDDEPSTTTPEAVIDDGST